MGDQSVAEMFANCPHSEWEFDSSHKEEYWYKCTKCGFTKKEDSVAPEGPLE